MLVRSGERFVRRQIIPEIVATNCDGDNEESSAWGRRLTRGEEKARCLGR